MENSSESDSIAHYHQKQELKDKFFRITHTEMNGTKTIRTHLTFDNMHSI
jgi:hypothetical protein